MKGLNGKVAVVTGGASGIGRAICAAFVAAGTDIVIADLDAAAAAETAAALTGGTRHVSWVAADTSDETTVAHTMLEAVARTGRLDILINGAAQFIMRGVDATVDDWQRILAVNVMGYALCAKHAAPHLRAAGDGSIVNISSVSAHIAQPDYVTYNTTKGAVDAMTRCLALDLAPAGIRVNSVNRTMQMMRNLLSHHGSLVHFAGVTLRCFFTPHEIATVSEEEFRLKDRLGYRAKFIGRYAEFFTTHTDALTNATTPELISEFQTIKGVGPYTVAVIASHASRDPSALGLDVWNRKLLARHLLDLDDATAEAVTAACSAVFPGYQAIGALYLIEHDYLHRPVAPLATPADLPAWNDRLAPRD